MKTFLTGANGDIGNAIKLKLEQMHYEVIAPTRQTLDLSSINSIDHYFKTNADEFEVIIHCAGCNNPEYIDTLDFDELIKTQTINIYFFFRIMQHVLPAMKQKNKGYVLGISSLYGTISREKRSAYAMSKHALEGFIQTLALEAGRYNILANTLSPGFVATQMTRKNNSPERIKQMESKIPLGRLADAEDIAEAAYFLCSEKNRYISGQNIIIDGGFMAGGFQEQ